VQEGIRRRDIVEAVPGDLRRVVDNVTTRV
jgi:hypothetical protein